MVIKYKLIEKDNATIYYKYRENIQKFLNIQETQQDSLKNKLKLGYKKKENKVPEQDMQKFVKEKSSWRRKRVFR